MLWSSILTGRRSPTVFSVQAGGSPPAESAEANDFEEVHDITSTPDGRHLLATVRLPELAGGYSAASRSRLILVDPTPEGSGHEQPRELLILPAEIVKGSFNWAADGKWVAFL